MSGDARKAFLAGLIDDAGLFPPASLSMDDAVAAHRASRDGENGWMLSRFICPASRLPELAKRISDEDTARSWRISVILDGAAGNGWLEGAVADMSAAREFSVEVNDVAGVELLEGLLPEAADPPLLRGFAEALESAGLPEPVMPFLEIPNAARLPRTLEVLLDARDDLRERGLTGPGAKLRCGGAIEELFPTPARVASFIRSCNRMGVPFKATAGLHHPFRHVDPETGFVQHGFVNLVGAGVLASAHDLDADEIEEIVSDQDPTSFSLTSQRFSWRDHPASESEIAAARASLFTSYGSCSFAEPVEDLTALGILPLAR
jgi:hypothetical protein